MLLQYGVYEGPDEDLPKISHLKPKTVRWLLEWAWAGDKWKENYGEGKMGHPEVPLDVYRDLRRSPYHPDKPITLYRGVQAGGGQYEKSKGLKSFTTERELAGDIAFQDTAWSDVVTEEEADELAKQSKGKIVDRKVDPDDVLIDLTKIPRERGVSDDVNLAEIIVIEPWYRKEMEAKARQVPPKPGWIRGKKPRSKTSGWSKLKDELPSSSAARLRIREGGHTEAYTKVLQSLERYWEKRGG